MPRKSENSVRVNIFLSKELKEWFQEKASESGASMSSYMAMALAQYKEQKEMVNFFSGSNLAQLMQMQQSEQVNKKGEKE